MQSNHTTVLLEEAVAALTVQENAWYIDATFGAGGHTRKILESGGNVIAFDFDQAAIAHGQAALPQHISAGTLIILRENFNKIQSEIQKLCEAGTVSSIQGVLFDFGTSTDQLLSSDRGFSIVGTGVLDMRMDERLGVTAKDLLAVVPEKQLARLFSEYGGEQDAKRIAHAIKTAREPINTAAQLSELVLKVKGRQSSRLHPATKVFQALRIAVNSELQSIQEALPQALAVLAPGGNLVTISFHDGEDRIAKHYFVTWEHEQKGTQLHRKPLVPSEVEVQRNPRSRSAKLRVFRKQEA